MSTLKKKISGAIVAFMMATIAISFIISGIDTSMKGTPDSLGSVGHYPIKIRDYSQELERQSQFYSQFSGGNPLTKEQIEAFRLRENALNNVSARLLMINFADDIGLHHSQKEVAKIIRDLPYFQVKGQFDLNTYKAVLPQNGFTAEEFENLIARDTKLQSIRSFTQTIGLSKKSLQDSKMAQLTQLQLSAITLNKDNIFKSIPVSAEDITSYLQSKDGLEKAKALFESRKPQLDVKEEIKARHILLSTEGKDEAAVKSEIEKISKTVTPKNFIAVANEKTEDPSGKEKGGDLGWFAAGMMVPEFDQVAFALKPGEISAPVKTQFGYHIIYLEDKKAAKNADFAAYQNDLVRELIQKSKKDESTKLIAELSAQIEEAFNKGDEAKLSALSSQYDLVFKNKIEISLLNGDLSFSDINFDQILESAKVAKAGEKKVLKYDSPLKLVFVSPIQLKYPTAITEAQIKEEEQKQKNVLMRKLNEDLVKILEEKYFTEKDKEKVMHKVMTLSAGGVLR
jgi:peptidyl-prolyl cis-trans isomerase D